MNTGKAIFFGLALSISSPALAEEVLYCTDTDATGFRFEKNMNAKARPLQFIPSRFTVKIISETERIINDGDGPPNRYMCFKRVDILSCVETDGVAFAPFNFGPKGYTRAKLLSKPLNELFTPDMYVAYGTCTKF